MQHLPGLTFSNKLFTPPPCARLQVAAQASELSALNASMKQGSKSTKVLEHSLQDMRKQVRLLLGPHSFWQHAMTLGPYSSTPAQGFDVELSWCLTVRILL